MKRQEIIFKRPIKILQVYRNINEYDKTMKSFDDRKEAMEWREIRSKNGHVADNELYLPEHIFQDVDINACGLIAIEDDNPPPIINGQQAATRKGWGYEIIHHHCFNLGGPNRLDIFKLKTNKEKELELFLQYGYFEVGIPERDNIKLCVIKKNSPVEIKINGKTEASLSARRARMFKEQHYIFDYIGDFTSCKLLKEPYDYVIKQVPAERKAVDMLKQLW